MVFSRGWLGTFCFILGREVSGGLGVILLTADSKLMELTLRNFGSINWGCVVLSDIF